ncbi:type IV conjugative transfer system lipoprotein TraV [Escherichia coli]|uniref:type IV conjugative transfer system lipoprotein TraV n=5 Tax=Enterobacteriaceae TaxID=543 RepID=UPI0035166A84
MRKVRDNETDFFIYSSAGDLITFRLCRNQSEFECNATTSDTCMTMEQANEKAKKLEQPQKQSRLRHHCRAWLKGTSGQPRCRPSRPAPSGSRPVVTALPEQKLLAPRPLFTAAREVKTIIPVSSVASVTPPRPLRTGEQTAALWIAPYIDNQDVYHQPSSVFFVIKPSAWGKPRIN